MINSISNNISNNITNNNDILDTIKHKKAKPNIIKRTKKQNVSKQNVPKQNVPKHNYITSEVKDEESYSHFKSLIANSDKLCHGKEHSGKRYKVNISLRKDYATLMKDNHYRTIYVHDNNEIIAYIGTKTYKKDGGFIFIHKVCSKSGTGEGTRLMRMILADAKRNHHKLGITYVSLTTHNLDLIDYYNKFKPTRTIEVDSPGSKRIIPRKVAYMIWQVSPDMPNLNY
jgi:hypothetical protein